MQSYRDTDFFKDHTFRWLPEFGWTARTFFRALTPAAFANLRLADFRFHVRWMASGSLPLIAWSAFFISLALTTQAVIELKRFQATNLAGLMIVIGLLREMGPLTVSLSWGARAAAYISQDASRFSMTHTDREFGEKFVLVRWLSALSCGVPLSGYGLVIGFLAGALYAPMLGVPSVTAFMDSARVAVKTQDLIVYFVKLCLINPTIGVFAGCVCGRKPGDDPAMKAANAIAATFIWGAIANFLFTSAVYLH